MEKIRVFILHLVDRHCSSTHLLNYCISVCLDIPVHQWNIHCTIEMSNCNLFCHIDRNLTPGRMQMCIRAIDVAWRQSSTSEKVPGRKRESNESKFLLMNNRRDISTIGIFRELRIIFASNNESFGRVDMGEIFCRWTHKHLCSIDISKSLWYKHRCTDIRHKSVSMHINSLANIDS